MGLGSLFKSVISTVAPIAPIVGAGLSFIGGERQNRASSAVASRQMQFQSDMSGTAHQREVKDLIAAGLNPILSATGGSGASSPAGSSFQPVNSVESSVSSARQGALVQAQLDNIRADTASKSADAMSTVQGTVQKQAEADFIKDHPHLFRFGKFMQALTGGLDTAHSAKGLITKKTPFVHITK